MARTIRFELEVPVQNLNHLLSDADKENILSLFKQYKLDEVYAPEKEIVISCRNVVEPGADILAGHKLWKRRNPEQVQTPGNLPRLAARAAAGARLLQLGIDYIDRQAPGFFSCYGYLGYYLSVIVDPSQNTILDARGEIADD